MYLGCKDMDMSILYFAQMLTVVNFPNAIAGLNTTPDKVYGNITGTACISFEFHFSVVGLISVHHGSNNTVLTAATANGDPTAVAISDEYKSRLHYNGNLNEKRVSFCLSNLTINDSGIYRLQKAGLSISTVTLFILRAPTTPRINGSSSLMVGSNVTLTCSATSQSLPTLDVSYIWRMNETQIISLVRHTINGDRNNTLEISHTEKTDKYNRYRCIATEHQGHFSSSNVTVLEPKYGPADTVQILSSPLIVVEGSNVTLICQADCNPRCSYSWRNKTSATLIESQQLQLYKVMRDQTGMYICEARNIIQQRERIGNSNINLTVHYAAVVTNMTITGDNYTLLEGSSPMITCEAEGWPMPEISLININADRIIASTNSRLKLEYRFPLVKCEDAGLYRCDAQNKFSPKPGLEHYVYVVCSPKIVVSSDGKTFLGINGNVTLTAILIAHPRPLISWYFRTNLDISEVKINTGIHIYSFGAYHTTYLHKMLKSDKEFGTYSLKASNSMGTVYTIFSVKDKEQENSQLSEYQTSVALFVVGSLLTVAGVCVFSVFFLAKFRKRNVGKKKNTVSESAYCDLEDERKQGAVYDTCQATETESDARRSSEQNYENPRSEQNYENPRSEQNYENPSFIS